MVLMAQTSLHTKPASPTLAGGQLLKTSPQPLGQTVKVDTQRIIKVQNIIKSYGFLKWFSGSVLVAKDGVPIYKTAGGFASLEYKVNCALDTKFNVGAITQLITATAIMQLAQNGQLNLGAPARQHLPAKMAAGLSQDITIRHLLSHSSGLPDYYSLPEYSKKFTDIKKISDMLDIIFEQSLHFTSGTQYEYSNSNYVVLAAIVEQVSGMSYQEYVRKKIFQPADMSHSNFYYWYEVVGNRAMAYQFNSKHKARTAADLFGAYPFGADGLYTTIEDLLKFDQALKSGKLVNKEHQTLLSDPIMATNDSIVAGEMMGYGWKSKMLNSDRITYQGGNIYGVSSQIRNYPDGYTIIVLSNFHKERAAEVAQKIENALYDKDYFVPSNSIAYYVYSLIEKNGTDYVKANLDELLGDINIKLEKTLALNKLAEELLYIEKNEMALAVLDINAHKFPNDPMIYDAYGNYYFKTANFEKSLQNFQAKLRLQPNDARAQGMIAFLNTANPKRTAELIAAGKKLKEKNNPQEPNNAVLLAKAPPPTKDDLTKTTILDVRNNIVAQTHAVEVDGKVERATAPQKELVHADSIYTFVPQMPEFTGGQKAIYQYISANIKYPPEAAQNNIEGTVYVSFVIDENGMPKNPYVERGLGAKDYGCHAEAIRIITTMPKWEPGYQEGKPVKVRYTIAVPFKKN